MQDKKNNKIKAKWTADPKGAVPLEEEQQNENVVPLEKGTAKIIKLLLLRRVTIEC